MNAEYVRNLHSNYVRLPLDGKPEEKKYQYCILSRGGIKGLLSCSLRYLDGGAYLYYDITSKQNLVQFYQKGSVSREWLLDFMGSFRRLQRELDRFLLREENVIWNPRHVFQDLENPEFFFMYVPYCEEEPSFLQFLAFLVEKADYDDPESAAGGLPRESRLLRKHNAHHRNRKTSFQTPFLLLKKLQPE